MFCMEQIVAYEKQRKAKKQPDIKGCKGITKSGKPCKNGLNCKIHNKGVKSDGI